MKIILLLLLFLLVGCSKDNSICYDYEHMELNWDNGYLNGFTDCLHKNYTTMNNLSNKYIGKDYFIKNN
jgi:hypothetical protein